MRNYSKKRIKPQGLVRFFVKNHSKDSWDDSSFYSGITRTLQFSIFKKKKRAHLSVVLLFFLNLAFIYLIITSGSLYQKKVFHLAEKRQDYSALYEENQRLKSELGFYQNPKVLLQRAQKEFELHMPSNKEITRVYRQKEMKEGSQ